MNWMQVAASVVLVASVAFVCIRFYMGLPGNRYWTLQERFEALLFRRDLRRMYKALKQAAREEDEG